MGHWFESSTAHHSNQGLERNPASLACKRVGAGQAALRTGAVRQPPRPDELPEGRQPCLAFPAMRRATGSVRMVGLCGFRLPLRHRAEVCQAGAIAEMVAIACDRSCTARPSRASAKGCLNRLQGTERYSRNGQRQLPGCHLSTSAGFEGSRPDSGPAVTAPRFPWMRRRASWFSGDSSADRRTRSTTAGNGIFRRRGINECVKHTA